MTTKSIPWYVWLIPVVILLVATARMPYGYYTFTRIAVCAISIWIAIAAWNGDSTSKAFSIGFALIAILFNPIIPVYLKRATWFYLDIGAAAYFAVHFLVVRLSSRT